MELEVLCLTSRGRRAQIPPCTNPWGLEKNVPFRTPLLGPWMTANLSLNPGTVMLHVGVNLVSVVGMATLLTFPKEGPRPPVISMEKWSMRYLTMSLQS